MTLVQETDKILLDEPTTYLDMDKQYEILDLIKQMQDKIIIMIIHDLPYALKYADNLVVMKEGDIMGAGMVEEVLKCGILNEVYNVKINEVIDRENKEYIVTK